MSVIGRHVLPRLTVHPPSNIREPGGHGRADGAGISQGVVARNADDGSPRAVRRHPERVALALHDERRDLNRVQLRQSALGGIVALAGRMQWEGEAQDATAPTSAEVRQATRAPADRPPVMIGSPSSASSRNCSRTAVQAASSWRAGAGLRRPATRYGCSTSATVCPAEFAASAAATMSGAFTPPPAPCPSTSPPTGRSTGWRRARARPWGVSSSRIRQPSQSRAGRRPLG